MEELTERQKLILSLVIREYTHTAEPVGSKHIVDRYNLDISSATVRNEMASLTDLGYLRQPHTSAGRVPTEEGYRYYVGRLSQRTELPDATRRMIIHQFYQSDRDMDEWLRLAASTLAHQAHGASLVTAPLPSHALFKHIELISTRGRQVLAVLVLVGGEIHQRIITLDEPFSQEELSTIANHLTSIMHNNTANQIHARLAQLQGLELEVTKWIVQDMIDTNAMVAGEVYVDGLTNVLAEPEFSGSLDARRALRVLEERSTLQDLLSRTILSEGESGGGVQVLIGGEGTWEDLRQCSIVLARYGSPDLATGTLGVLGPMRMPYGRTISTVRFISSLLSELVVEVLGD